MVNEFLKFDNVFQLFENGFIMGLGVGFIVWLFSYAIKIIKNVFKKITY